jgi:hypothetical protein
VPTIGSSSTPAPSAPAPAAPAPAAASTAQAVSTPATPSSASAATNPLARGNGTDAPPANTPDAARTDLTVDTGITLPRAVGSATLVDVLLPSNSVDREGLAAITATVEDAAIQAVGALSSDGNDRTASAGGADMDRWREAFSSLRGDLQRAEQAQSSTLASGATLSAGLSVGYVVWILRGGVLLSSMLAALPAWQLVDPMPLLARSRLDDNEDDQPGDDVESLFGRRATAAPTGDDRAEADLQEARA